jgi:hypothetical protein
VVDAFHVRAWDGTHLSSNDVSVLVEVVQPPVAQSQNVSTPQDTPLNITLTGTDADNDQLTYQVLTQPSNGTLTGTAPNLTYQPAAGFIGSDNFTFIAYDGQVPSAPATVNITVTPPILPIGVFAGHNHVLLGTNSVALKGQAADNNGNSLTITWSVVSQPTGASVQFTDASNPQAVATFSGPGAYQLRLTATDSLTNASADVYFWVIPALPPDPATVAPPLDQTEPTCLTKATEFLYTGNNPIQIGVAPGTIVFERAAVLHGRILDSQGNGLPGVGVTVLAQPEFGATVSRADGGYDLVVNGGAPLTLNFEKSGFIAVQRRADVPWQRYVNVDDVVMTPYDANSNVITFNSGGTQLATGSVDTDAAGTRQAAVFFPSGTSAQMVFGGTVTQSVQSLNVRLTEYTVGTNGPKAMPAPLPPNSAYTYCIELSADAADAAEADTVVFSQPVSFYLENFIGFRTGTAVPVGFYDRQRGCWVPSANGRVVKVLANNGGQVTLDVDGSGNAATQDELNQLGITQAELAGLAQRYQPGQSLWRAQLSHFTPFDYNWGFPDLLGPRGGSPSPPGGPPTEHPDKHDPSGLTYDIQNQSLGGVVEITGTPFSLHYSSEFAPGHLNSLSIPIRDANPLPPIISRIDISVSVAGQTSVYYVDPSSTSPNQQFLYTWDGKDSFGRQVYGQQVASITITYEYPAQYEEQSGGDSSAFMSTASVDFSSPYVSRQDQVLMSFSESYEWPIWSPESNPPGNTIGGWTLSDYHVYNPSTKILVMGDGTQRSALSVNEQVNILTTNYADFVASAPDGSLVFSDGENIMRRTPSGQTEVIAGGGGDNPVNGGWATNIYTGLIRGLAVGPDNSVYFSSAQFYQIWKVETDGRLQLIAGTGTPGYSGDGGLATNAALSLDRPSDPVGMTVAPGIAVLSSRSGHLSARRYLRG